jgi:hypothetical protein
VELIERLRTWTYSCQRLGRRARTPEEALDSVVAVYATHPTCPLALSARTQLLTGDRYRRIDRDRKGLRIPAMRRTLFLVPRKDAPSVFTAVRQSPAQALRGLKRHGISLDDYEQIAGRVLAAAREPTQGQALNDVVDIGGQPLGTVLRCLRHEGRLLALAGESLMMSAHRYVATAAWAPEGLDAGDTSNALAWLAGAYLRAYGPARVEDFSWWAGVTKRAASRALEPHRTVDVGDGLLLHARDEAAFERAKPLRGTVDLLPKWDAYTMGHAPDGRRRFVDPEVQDLVYTPVGTGLPGDGNPVVLVDGQVAGLWSYTLKDRAAVDLFDSLGPTTRRRLDGKLAAVAEFLVE